MNKKYFNSKFKEANATLKKITAHKTDIHNLISEIKTKKELLNAVFNERMSNAIKKEDRIKTLMDNRHFKFMKMVDFLSAEDLFEQQGFLINEDSGFLLSEILKQPKTDLFKKSKNPSNDKELIFEFDNNQYSNLMSFSFKDVNGLPITPKNVRVEYNGKTEDFFEPNFRYYNRNSKNVFVNNFFFYPKKILKVYATFDVTPDFNTSFCDLYSCSFNTDSNNFAEILISNSKGIKNFNIYKNSDENNVPLIFEFTEDNSVYNPIEFKNQEAVISLSNAVDFKIRIRKDYENVVVKEFTEVVKNIISYNDMDIINNVATFDFQGRIKNFDVVFSQSGYRLLKEEMFRVFGDNEKIDSFIMEGANKVYKLKREYVNLINESDPFIDSLIYFDSIDDAKDNNALFNFYINEKDKKLHFANFFKEFSFFLELENEVVVDNISANLLTPYVFDLQIKG
ncbi:MAG: hypothetical protein ACRCXX_14275 [Cetobacterium sp.]|uniref:hypothetical protein n=1 Tax=Cetobacterium sp. TaxID=2071632 RepID=UPI003F37DF42